MPVVVLWVVAWFVVWAALLLAAVGWIVTRPVDTPTPAAPPAEQAPTRTLQPSVDTSQPCVDESEDWLLHSDWHHWYM